MISNAMPWSLRTLTNDRNIQPKTWEAIIWQKGKMQEGLIQLRLRVQEEALEAINWYYGKKQSKNRWSRWLRFWTITFTIMGGLVPILAATGFIAYIQSAACAEGQRLAEIRFIQ